MAETVATAEQQRLILQLPDAAIASLPTSNPDKSTLPPLVILLHGAGQSPAQMISRFAGDPDWADMVLLAPKSFGPTWDIVSMVRRKALEGASATDRPLQYVTSRDADRVMSAMAMLAQTTKTDPARQVLLGFSDGATFALALGTGRDRPFTTVVALSPGLSVVNARPARGRAVVVMHGKKDRSLPFKDTRTTIIPALQAARLTVRFVPFDGGHEIPEDLTGILIPVR